MIWLGESHFACSRPRIVEANRTFRTDFQHFIIKITHYIALILLVLLPLHSN